MTKSRFLSLLLAVAIIVSLGAPAFAAPPATPESQRIPAGQNGYLSLHKYASKTDVENVYKVELSLEGKIIPPTIDIAIVLDHTGSMNASDIPSSSLTRWEAAVNGAKEAGKVFLDPAEHPMGMAGADKTRVAVSEFTYQYSYLNGGNFYTTDAVAASSGTMGLTDLLGNTPNIGLSWLSTQITNFPTYVASGMKSAYDILSPSTADYKYVLFLGDGGDGYGTAGVTSSTEVDESTARMDGIAYAKLIKGDPAVNYSYTLKDTYGFHIYGGIPDIVSIPGLGAEIWVIALGSTLNNIGPNQAADMLASPGSPWAGTSYNATTGMLEPPGTIAVFQSRQADVPDYLMTVAGKYQPASAAYTNPTIDTGWTAIAGNTYGSAIQEFRSNSTGAADIHYEHSDGTNLSALFKEYAQKMLQVISNVHVEDVIGDKYEIYQMPGKPLLDAQVAGPKASTLDPGTPTIQGKAIDWVIPSEIDDDHTFTLTYYVKMDGDVDPALHYETNKYAYAQYTFDGKNYVIYFPKPYASPQNGEKVEEGDSGSAISTGTGGGYTGHDGHQDNRETNKDMNTGTGWGGGADIAPNITDVKAGTDSSGRSKVQVDLSNGSSMRYQWQFKNAAGEWEDIFGATGSHYTLGKQFAAGQEYELRAKITNPAGKVTFTDSIKVTAELGSSAGLQSKEEGPSIEGDQVMDAGEEIAVANTATTGQNLLLIAGALVLFAALLIGIRTVKRRIGSMR